MTMGRLASTLAALPGPPWTVAASAAACRSVASIRRARAWVRWRTLAWFVAEAGSRAARMRAASRNEVRAPSSACTRSSSGVQRALSSSQTGENVTPAMDADGRHRQTPNRGASTSTVPNKVCSRRLRRSLRGRSTWHSGQTRRQVACSATWLHTMLSCSLASSALASDSARPTSTNVSATAGRLIVTNSVVSTSPRLVLASSRTVHCITPALVVRHQPGRSARDRQAMRLSFLPLPRPPELGVERLDGVRGVEQPPHLGREGVERHHLAPGPAPARADGGILTAPGPLLEGGGRGLAGGGVDGAIEVLQRRGDRL